MALIKTLRGVTPRIDDSVFLAETAVIIGDVEIGKDSSVWYNVVLRGDVHSIRIGERTNVQDGAVVHCTYQKAKTTIGNDVTIGHLAMVHGCTIHDHCLIGMSSVILDDAVVESNVILGAGSLVLQGQVLESGHLYAGSPARKIKPLGEAQIKGISQYASHYQMYSGWFKDEEAK